ncbi:MAG TPA: hypothetical protein PLB97_10465 [Accumulibacter sp.]|nr:hypothetical protein [Accumulibacter sp.]
MRSRPACAARHAAFCLALQLDLAHLDNQILFDFRRFDFPHGLDALLADLTPGLDLRDDELVFDQALNSSGLMVRAGLLDAHEKGSGHAYRNECGELPAPTPANNR